MTTATAASATELASFNPETMPEVELFVAEMLTKGYTAEAAADVSGVPVDRVRSIATFFAEEIGQERVKDVTTKLEIEALAKNIERLAMYRLQEMVVIEQDMGKVAKLANAMSLVNERNRLAREGKAAQHGTDNFVLEATVVRLSLPNALIESKQLRNTVVLDSNSRVISIDNKAVATAGKSIIQQMEDRRTQEKLISAEDFQDD